jgi:hypothetical protein
MKNKEVSGKETQRRSSRWIAALKLSQAQQKQLGEMLLTKAKQDDVFLVITSESKGTAARTATILAVPASEAENWGLDPRSGIEVGEIRE